ncbi:MAG: peptidylprolyl isomerase [Propionibacteriaceae bacterium]|nr:peptidylprolyl isomerase [Propionibacteriaceae bacterium]
MFKKVLGSVMVVMALALVGCAQDTPAGDVTPTDVVPTRAPFTGTCEYLPSGTSEKEVEPPSETGISDQGERIVSMNMSAGEVRLVLDRKNAPCAVHAIESLVEQGYYNDTNCHRLVPGFVLQCGDPTGTGRGGPGYRFADELTGAEDYTYGTLAMANAGPNTNGSQFFIIISNGVNLDPNYTILGHVDPNSMAVIDSIAAQGVDPNDPNGIRPAEGGYIASMSII